MKNCMVLALVLAAALWPGRSTSQTALLPLGHAAPPTSLETALASLHLDSPVAAALRASDAGFSFTAGTTEVELQRAAPVVSAAGIRMNPLGVFRAAETHGGLVCYRSADGHSALVYRPTLSGVKEDLVLLDASAFGAGLFGWSLDLDGLEARLEEDGSIGLYGPGDELAHVNVCDSQSAALVAKVRERAAKTRLVARMPAPIAYDAERRAIPARFRLSGAALAVVVEPGERTWPITVDPTIVFTTDSDFRQNGNDEGLVKYAGNQVHRDTVAGWNVPSWTSTTNFANARYQHSAAVYNKFVYVVAGYPYPGDLQFAPINDDGTVGSWSATTAFPSAARKSIGLAAYNGYMYVTGGTNSSDTVLNDSYYAKINNDGTISPGAWQSGPTIPNGGRDAHGFAALGGFLYIIGGRDAGLQPVSDVFVAPIRGDGSIGPWGSTSSMTNFRSALSSFAADGFVYAVGGTNGTFYLSSSEFARQNPDGSLGPWTASSSMAGPRAIAAGVVSGGYAFVISGNDGTGAIPGVTSAPLLPGGGMGPWSTTTPLPIPRQACAAAVYNGRIIVTGGGESSPPFFTTSVFTGLPRAGDLPAWSSTASFATGRNLFASVAYNGYLYLMGGSVGFGPGVLSDVQVAPINADGTLGGWTGTGSFPTARHGIAAAAYNGFLYVAGGNNSGANTNLVHYAPINANGTVGGWTAGTSLPEVRNGGALVARNGFLYMVGGGTPVRYASINTNGSIGSWTATGAHPESGHAYFGCFAYGNFLYTFGGQNASGGTSLVYYAPFNANGSVGSWTTTTALPAGVQYTAQAHDGYVYAMKTSSAGPNTIHVAPINGDGTIGAWTATTLFNGATRDFFATAVANGNLYMLGGRQPGGGPDYTDTQFTRINAHGTLGAWTPTNNFNPTGRAGGRAVSRNGYLYLVGGASGVGTATNTVFYSPINMDGSVTNWQSTSSFSTSRANAGVDTWNGRMYLVGGDNAAGSSFGDVQFAVFNGDGTLASWAPTTSYTSVGPARRAFGFALYNGYLYILGGTTGGPYLTDVFYAPINADGTVGAWATTTSLPSGRGPTSFAYNGFLYALGGSNGSANISDTLVAPINANGTIGSWQSTTSLPDVLADGGVAARGGYVYIGGGGNSSFRHNEVHAAPILANGLLGPWTARPRFTGARAGPGMCIASGFLYCIGGTDPGNAMLNDVQYVAVRMPASRATYSRLIDLGSDQTVASITTSGGGSSGVARLDYRLATSGGPTFGPASTTNPITFGGAVTVSQTARYVFLRYTLDDSGSVTRSPDTTAHLAIDDITLATTSPPAVPVGVNQFQSDGLTAIALGAGATSTTVKFIATVTDPDGDTVRLHVEVVPINVAFANVPTHSSGFVSSGSPATATAVLTPGVAYHWQAVTEDITGTFSQGGAVLFGGNTENPPTNPAATDLFIDQAPTAPTMSQFESDGSTVLANGGTAGTSTVVLKGVRNDADTTLSLVKVQLEFRDNATPFTSPPGIVIAVDNVTFFESSLAAPGTTASFTISSLAPGGYKWQMRNVDDTGLASAWTVFNATQPNFTVANPNAAPDVPALSQTNGDDSALAVGGTTNTADVKLSGTLTDPNAGDTLTLQIELRLVGVPFTSPGTPVIDGVVFFQVVAGSPGAASLTQLVSSLPDGSYHWQARTVDDAGPAASAWTPFGANTEAEPDFVVDQINDPPAVTPATADQFQPDNVTVIAVGGNATTTGVTFKAQLVDGNAGDTIKLQVELQDVGVALTGTFTHESTFVASGATASIVTGALVIGNYHWAFRAVDNNGNPGPWTSFGANTENPPTNPADDDFKIVANTGPAVSALAQFFADGTTPLPTGMTTTSVTLVLQATMTDPEAQACTLEVEVQPVGTPFTGTPTATAASPAASGSTVQITVTVAGEGAYHWQARATDVQGGIGAYVAYDANPEEDPDFRVELTDNPPTAPTSLGQYVPPGTTGLALGGSPLGRTVIVRGVAVDPEGRQVQLQVEVQPLAAAFTGTPTHSSSPTPSGIFGSVTLNDLADGPFHWQMRTLDNSAQASAWVSYGSNPESSADFTITATTAVPPNDPLSLEQRTSNGLAVIGTGVSISQAAIRMRAQVVHPRTEIVKLQIEVKPLAAPFTGAVDKESDFVDSGSIAEVLVFGFPNDDYHWQARSVDSKGTTSAWVIYGSNAETDSDFRIDVVSNSAASLPILVGQFQADGITLLPIGATTTQTTVVYQAFLSDPNGDAVRLEVETKPIGIAFDGAVSGTSPFAANGSLVWVEIGGTSDGRYHWRARATDSNGSSSAWVAYGGNPEDESDWIVNGLTNVLPDPATGLDQLRDNATVSVGVGEFAGAGALAFRANASDADGDLVRVEVEIRPAAEALTGVATHSGLFGPSGFAADAVVDRFTLQEGQHWQARVVDSNGQTAGWVDFGGNGASDTDFVPSFNVSGQTSRNKVCGALGLEALLLIVLARLAHRSRRRRR